GAESGRKSGADRTKVLWSCDAGRGTNSCRSEYRKPSESQEGPPTMMHDTYARGLARPVRTFTLALGFVTLMWAGPWLSQASAQGGGDAPPPPLAPTSERIFPELHDFRETLP